MSLFDGIQSAAFKVTQSVFGDVAVWKPSTEGSEQQTEKVLYKCPNDPVQIGESDKYEYRPYDYSFEYYVGQFTGLKELVDNSQLQKVTVNGNDLIIRQVIAKFDGKTLVAYGERTDPELV